MRKLFVASSLLILPLLVGAFSSPALAWSDHYTITTGALRPVTSLVGKTAPYTSFQSLVHALGYANRIDFNTHMQISKHYVFAPKLGEKPGQQISVLAILSKYSDEPDWGMDQELFGPHEYPQLWDPAYSMMGGKLGVPSQAFRHMYWQAFDIWHPFETFKLPLNKEFKSMGQAPERAALFVQLSREAHAKGQPYWSVRFLADALHYLQDCAQPYHTVQVPTIKFLYFPFFSKYGHGLHHFVEQMTNIIVYYHFSFEDFVAKVMVNALNGSGNIAGNQFLAYLSAEKHGPRSLSYQDHNMARLVRHMAHLGMKQAAAAGSASIKFFPKIDEDYLTMDPRFKDHEMGVPVPPQHKIGFEDATWWAKTEAAGAHSSPARQQYFNVIRKMFGPLGYAVRQVVTSELNWLTNP